MSAISCGDTLIINIIDCNYLLLIFWSFGNTLCWLIENILCWTVDNIVCWIADNIFLNSVYNPFNYPLNYSISYPFIQSLIQLFNFHSPLQMNCWHLCWKSISSANEIIKSIPFLNCLRLARTVLLCPITSYGTVHKQKLLLRCHERREFQ